MKNTKKLAWEHFDKQMRAECNFPSPAGLPEYEDDHEYAVELKASIKEFKDTDPTPEQIMAFTRVCVAMFNYAYS